MARLPGLDLDGALLKQKGRTLAMTSTPRRPSSGPSLTTAVSRLVRRLGVAVSETSLHDELELHPYFPSFDSARDALAHWGVSAQGLRVEPSLLPQLPVPFLVRQDERDFTAVLDVDESHVTLSEGASGSRRLPISDLALAWDGTALLVETTERAGDREYETARRAERRDRFRRVAVWVGCALAVLAAGVLAAGSATSSLQAAGLWSLRMLGLVASGLLVTHYLSKGASLLRRVCDAGRGAGCAEVLDSPAAKPLGVPLADVGVVYFATGLLALFVGSMGGIASEVVALQGWLAAAALPMVGFSLVYQARVLKTWCMLCVGVQGVLLLDAALALPSLQTSLQAPSVFAAFGTSALWLVAWSYVAVAGFWALFRTRSDDARSWKDQTRRLLRHPKVIASFLEEGREVPAEPLPGDIVLRGHSKVPGSLDSVREVLLVTHADCRHCGEAHRLAEELLERVGSSLRIRVRFLSLDDGTPGRQLADRAVGLALERRHEEAADLLHAWFVDGERDPLAERWPLRDADKTPARAREALQQALHWCAAQDVSSTPLVVVDGAVLPPMIRLDDLVTYLKTSPAAETDGAMDGVRAANHVAS